MHSVNIRLAVESLETRDVPAQWYTVTVDSPAQGQHGESALTVDAGGLEKAIDVWADSPADAIRLGVTGWVDVGNRTYVYSPEAVGTSSADRRPFLVAATLTGYEIRLEDLAGTPQSSDWDYNDTTWGVSVDARAADFANVSTTTADQKKPPEPDPKATPKELPKPPSRPPVVPAPNTGNDKDGKPYLPENPTVIPYKDTPSGNAPYQGGHLYQQSPFNTWIHSGRAGTIPMYGSTTTPTGQHYTFHYYVDEFWNEYRVGGAKEGQLPTLADYEKAVRKALEKMGYSAVEAKRIQEDARKMMDQYRKDLGDPNKYPPLKDTDLVPYIPPPTVQPAPQK